MLISNKIPPGTSDVTKRNDTIAASGSRKRSAQKVFSRSPFRPTKAQKTADFKSKADDVIVLEKELGEKWMIG